MKRALVFCTFAVTVYAQYPGGYPGGYPGRYPGGGYPNGGTVPGIPLPGRGAKSKTPSKNDQQPLPNFRGRLKQIDEKSITIDLDDYRVLEFKRTDKTKFFKNGQETKSADFTVGDKVSVEGPRDQEGFLTAVNVYWEGAAQKTANERDKGVYDTWSGKDEADKAASASGTAPKPEAPQAAPAPKAKPPSASAAKPRDDGFDPGPPSLRRGKPADSAREHAAPVPEQPPSAPSPAPPATAQADLHAPVAQSAPPPEMAVNRPIAPPPPPDDDVSIAGLQRPMDPLIRKATEAALDFTATLPDYVCQEMMTRTQSETSPASWVPLDVVTTNVLYRGGKEEYRDVAINGKKTNKAISEIGGAWSTGEFGTVLIDLFSPSTNANFRYRGDSRIAGIAAKEYDFDVERANSHWTIHFASETYDPAYKGTVWIDPATARVLRIEMQALNFPNEFPSDHVESATDYQYVRLGDARQYLLPVHAETLSCQRGSNYCSKNAIDFRNYHKYTGESSIQYQDVNSTIQFDDKTQDQSKEDKTKEKK